MFKNIIATLLAKNTGLKKNEISRVIEIPKQDFGDYAFPCFILSKKLKKKPDEMASELSSRLRYRMPIEIEKIEAKGPYVNFFFNKEILVEDVLKNIEKQRQKYGSSNIGKGERALIEHTSLNPNSSPHVGRARNALIGDSIARLLKFHGYKTEIHYYVNDVSKQIAMLVLEIKGNETFDDMLKVYIKAAKKIEDRKTKKKYEKQIFEILNKLEKRDWKVRKKIRRIVDICVKGQKDILKKIGIEYDSFDYESKYLMSGKISDIIHRLNKTGKLDTDKHGRLFINQKGTGLEKEMRSPILVLTRSDNTGLYVLRDLAYTIDKLKRAQKNIIILGEEQKLYFKQLRNALNILGYPSPEVLHYSFVLLKDKKGKKKMSTRKGDLVLLSDFLSEAIKKADEEMKKRNGNLKNAQDVAIAAIKYGILKTEENKNVTFSWDEALNFEGDSGPYLQYAYARASSILRKAGKYEKIKVSEIKIHEKEAKLARIISLFPEICSDSLTKLEPHLLANYAYKLAKTFNDFYEFCPVLNSEGKEKELRLSLVKAFQQTIKTALNLLGIKTLEIM